ncbi:hypothetical protein, partial [Achromobacter insolitus]|uniref:hypothetical protein n=1 Tax=Achromobacter insolitus TaxID=217204 RepID=UPI0020B6EE6C
MHLDYAAVAATPAYALRDDPGRSDARRRDNAGNVVSGLHGAAAAAWASLPAMLDGQLQIDQRIADDWRLDGRQHAAAIAAASAYALDQHAIAVRAQGMDSPLVRNQDRAA